MVRPLARRARLLRAPRDTLRYRRIPYTGAGKKLVVSPRLWWGVLTALLVVSAFHLFLGQGGVLRGLQLERELEHQQTRNASLRNQIARVRGELQYRENDLLSMEKLSRERYGMAAEDELIFRFEDDEIVPTVPADRVRDEGGFQAGDGDPGRD